MRTGVVQDLIEREARKIGKLHFHNRPYSLHGSPDRISDYRVCADQRASYAPGKFFRETCGGFNGPAKGTADVVFAVTGEPQDGGYDQLRRPPCSRPFNRATDHIQACGEIRSVEAVTFEAVTDRAINQIMTRKLAVVRR